MSRHPCHVTFKVKKDVHPLRSAKLVNELERSWREACDRGRFRLVQYSIQGDHVHVLKTPREVRNAIAYVLLNARRHLAKRGRPLPRTARVDPASSGRWFAGWLGGSVEGTDPPAVAAPGTWLLSVGWRRRGLIDPAEVPGK